ncbi:MAG: hypothetical protein J6N72_05890, partial [Psychrobacter sp.]|nr:hypothetical protein [Psychrobacter sp.]
MPAATIGLGVYTRVVVLPVNSESATPTAVAGLGVDGQRAHDGIVGRDAGVGMESEGQVYGDIVAGLFGVAAGAAQQGV